MSTSIFINLTATAASIAGLVAAVSALATAKLAQRRAQRNLEGLREEQEEAALASSNIESVGAYLYDNIGPVRVSDYVREDKTRTRTEAALRRLTDFLGERSDPDVTPPPTRPVATVPVSDQLSRAEEEIIAGEIWNGLARLRRDLEVRLRGLVPANEGVRVSAGRLIALAEHAGAIPQASVDHLRYAVSVANKAIHGEEVDTRVALEALRSARYGLGLLEEVRG